MRSFSNEYLEVAKYAFAVGTGATLAWSLVRGGRKLVKGITNRVASMASSSETLEISDED